MESLKIWKAVGCDNIQELIKASGEVGIDKLHRICRTIWKSRKWPGDWVKSVIVTLYKKGDMGESSNYRTLSMISHCSKIILWIITRRMSGKIEEKLRDTECGFRAGLGTRDQIFNLGQIGEKYLEKGKSVSSTIPKHLIQSTTISCGKFG